MLQKPFLSVIVPVYNGGEAFASCLHALTQSTHPHWELIVVNDGSTDDSVLLAEKVGATILHTSGREGPGAARNLGAKVAQGEFLCFIDADCEAYPDTLARLANLIVKRPELDAIFGSYDDRPKAENFVAQYKNLMHHYVHQRGNNNASTFWAGCGAVRRSTFLEVGGFDVQRFPRPSIEDIDLGYRIRQAGGQIHLAKGVLVKHHKAWTLQTLIKTDVFDRGIPWTQLLFSYESAFVNDLNLQISSRISVIAAYAILLFAFLSLYYPTFVWLVLLATCILVVLNKGIYRFFYRKRGPLFALRVLPMNWLYYLYSGVAFVVGILTYWYSHQGFNISLNKPSPLKGDI